MPRDEFVPAACRNLAYADTKIPLGEPDQCMMPPNVEARMLQALQVRATDQVLEIGTGSGYLTALLAKTGNHVVSVEIDAALSKAAAAKLEAHGISNVTLEVGDAANGWEAQAPYDAIAVTGSLPVLPKDLQYSLRPGGRLFAIVGEAPVMEAVLITRLGNGDFRYDDLFETSIPPLRNAAEPDHFTF
jgi:protein-L-isoaspartate(D-aspartate) O-methyltransferase